MKEVVFGPIASRRLGRSLGIDLLCEKICCQDCIYCEAGRTKKLTCERKQYIPAEKVISQLQEVLAKNPQLDFITFSGSGEPTLSTALGEVADFLKSGYPQHRICLLSNGMLLHDRQVRKEIRDIDLVIPSLDASNEQEFLQINRPDSEVSFKRFIDGLADFSCSFKGKIWLELFIVPGMNDSAESISRFAGIISRLRVDRIQLNSLDRPGTEADVKISSAENAGRFAEVLRQYAPVEFIGSLRSRSTLSNTADSRLLELLAAAPAGTDDIRKALELSVFETGLLLDKMEFAGKIHKFEQNKKIFWSLKNK